MNVSPRDVRIINIDSHSFQYDFKIRVEINGKYYNGFLEMGE